MKACAGLGWDSGWNSAAMDAEGSGIYAVGSTPGEYEKDAMDAGVFSFFFSNLSFDP